MITGWKTIAPVLLALVLGACSNGAAATTTSGTTTASADATSGSDATPIDIDMWRPPGISAIATASRSRAALISAPALPVSGNSSTNSSPE